MAFHNNHSVYSTLNCTDEWGWWWCHLAKQHQHVVDNHCVDLWICRASTVSAVVNCHDPNDTLEKEIVDVFQTDDHFEASDPPPLIGRSTNRGNRKSFFGAVVTIDMFDSTVQSSRIWCSQPHNWYEKFEISLLAGRCSLRTNNQTTSHHFRFQCNVWVWHSKNNTSSCNYVELFPRMYWEAEHAHGKVNLSN